MGSPGSSEAEDEEAEEVEALPIPGPSRVKYDFFKPFAGAKPSKVVVSDEEVEDEVEVEEEEEGENSWIVEDDGPEGVPELPVAFNMSSHQDLSHHFKIICQLFVHLAVRSPSQRVSFMQDVKACKHMNPFQKRSFHMTSEICCLWCSFSRGQLLLCCAVDGPAKANGNAGLADHFIDLANRVQESLGEISRVEHGADGFRGSRLRRMQSRSENVKSGRSGERTAV